MNPANGINHTLYKNLPFSILTDLAPVAGLITSPNVMEVTNSFPAKTVAEFISYCKANPGKINMASSGSGTSVHMSGELFMMMTGCKMLHVPYKGAGPALTELIGGTVHVLFDNLPSSAGHIKGGRIRAIAVTTTTREPSMPDVPTVAETVPGYEAVAWFGLGAPKGTPKEIVDKLNAEVNRALSDPKMKERLADLGGHPDVRHAGGLRQAHRRRGGEVVQGREGLGSHAQLSIGTRYTYQVRVPGTFRWRACAPASPRSNRSCLAGVRPGPPGSRCGSTWKRGCSPASSSRSRR